MVAKKKILIRIGSLRHGGAEKVLVTFLKNLSPDKYEIDLLLNKVILFLLARKSKVYYFSFFVKKKINK